MIEFTPGSIRGVRSSQPFAKVGLRSSALAVPPLAGAFAGGFLAAAPFAASVSSSIGIILSKFSHMPLESQIELSKDLSIAS